VAPVAIAHPDRPGNRLELRGLLDTGADWTCVPEETLEVLMCLPTGRVLVETADGSKSYLLTYEVLITLFGQDCEVAVIAVPGTEPLIGRDLLNQYVLTLDGPALLLKL
jgi:predicted aspartyl protease